MKQLLFLLLFPCLALAQYPGNAGQKITLGEQTTADGLVYRGLAADTTRKPSVDTMAFILLDTNTNIIWQYKKATNNAWTRVGGSISSGVTGVLPVANGGTNASTLAANKVMVGNGTSGVLTPTELNWNNTNKRLGINTSSPVTKLHLNNNGLPVNSNLVTLGFDLTINSHESAGIRLITSNNSGSSGLYNFINAIKSRGTNENPSTPLLNDYIFGILSNAYDGSSGGGGTAGIFFIADANVSAGVAPQRISFLTSETNNVGRIERLIIKPNGNVGIGTASPTARLHLIAGTASASSAPLKFTSGTNLTTAEAGAMEFNGTNLFFSPSTTRHTVNHGLTGSATLNFPSTTTLLSADLTITVTGAADGDVVSLGVPNAAVNANTSYSAWVSAANTVTVRFNNYSSGTVDPASGTFKVFVTK